MEGAMHALSVRNLNVWYGEKQSLKNISLDIPARQITAIIGPSGCGKTTLLKTFNRLLELNEEVRVQGEVIFDGANIYAPDADVTEVRTRIGLLAQKPFPLPMSIYDNIAYGPRIHGLVNGKLNELVQSRLQDVGLWDDVFFMWLGELVEHGPAADFFAHPRQELTQAYLNREIG
jgi:phosphate transport system ATP-binding protein